MVPWLWIILGGLAALIWGVSRLRLGLRVAFGDGAATADLTVGPFRWRLAPSKEKKTAEKPVKKRAKTEKKESKKSAADKLNWLPRISFADVRAAAAALAPAAKRALRRTRRSIRLDPLRLSLTLGGGADPAAAAEQYGWLHAAVWTGMPVLEQLVSVPSPHIHIGIDFDVPQARAMGALGISIRIGTLIAVGTGMSIPALRWFLKLRKTKSNGQPPASAPEKTPEQTAA